MTNRVVVLLSDLKKAALNRPENYLATVLACGRIEGDHLVLEFEQYERLQAMYSKARKPAAEEVYKARQKVCAECIDEVCRRCPKTEVERRAEDGLCPLGMWEATNRR